MGYITKTVKYLEGPTSLMKGVTETIENERKEQKIDFWVFMRCFRC